MTESLQDAVKRFAAEVISKGYELQPVHPYEDSSGTIIYWRIRAKHPETGEKWIRPMHLNGNGYELGEPKFADGKPLYGLHLIAGNPDADVWITEGEQKADALNKLGLTATTSGGATSASAADWTPLKGRTVRIWPDNDEPGKGYAGEVAKILIDMGCTVSCVDLSKLGLGIAEDVVDWLKTHPEAHGSDVEALPTLTPSSGPENAPTGVTDNWPEPQPLMVKVAPEPYPLDALPDTIRAAVIEVQGFTKAPIPMVASSALAALSLAIQAHADVKRADKLHGPVGLFLLTIADSGERKSTCDGFFTKAIHDYEEAQAEAGKPILNDYQSANAAWEAERDGIIAAIKQAGKTAKPVSGKDIKTLRAELADHQRHQPQTPRIPRLLYADATPEALAYGLAHYYPSGGIVSAEGGIVFGSHGMGKDSIMRNLSMLNQLWDGNSVKIDRRTSASYTVKGARLTVALQVQEPTLREFLKQSGALARGTGFLARFLVAYPESTQGFRPFTEAPANWTHLAAFNRRIALILDQPAPIDEHGALTPPMLSMTPEAKAAWIEFHDEIERELASGGDLHEVKDVASKSADNVARLATLFHVFSSTNSNNSSSNIQIAEIASAIRIVAWHLNESRRFFGELALPVEMLDAARLDTWLIEHCRQERTDFVRKNYVRQHGPLRDAARLDAAIRELTELERLRLVKDVKPLTIHINPALMIEAVS